MPIRPLHRAAARDPRFRAEAWRKHLTYMAQAFLLAQQWWHNVSHEVRASRRTTRRWCRSRAPDPRHVLALQQSFLNPEVMEKAAATAAPTSSRASATGLKI